MYLKGAHAKLEIGVAKGKRQYDKRAAIADRDAERRTRRELKEYSRDQD
jgi:SsrA-binding protein